MLETRKAKMIVNKSGSGNSIFRATLPNSWIRQMGLSEDNRNLKLEFDGKVITIKNNEEVEQMKKELIEQLKKDNTIEQLQEVGKIDIDCIDEDLELLIEVLEEEFQIKTEIKDLIGGRYLVNLDYRGD